MRWLQSKPVLLLPACGARRGTRKTCHLPLQLLAFEGRPSLHAEDLFVVPELRGIGIGKALLARAAAIAVSVGSQRLQWEGLDWNVPAIEFYETLGAKFGDVWRNMRLTGETFGKLAELAKYTQQEAAA